MTLLRGSRASTQHCRPATQWGLVEVPRCPAVACLPRQTQTPRLRVLRVPAGHGPRQGLWGSQVHSQSLGPAGALGEPFLRFKLQTAIC